MASTSFFLLLLSILCLYSSSSFLPNKAPTYNPMLAKKFWHLCMASYCSVDRIQNWNLGFVTDLFPRMTDITVISNSTGNACGYTAYNPDEDEVIMVFRGTEILSVKNWIDDIDTFFTVYSKCEGCKVRNRIFFSFYLS